MVNIPERQFFGFQKVERIIVITTNPYYPKWKCLYNKYKIEKIENVIIFRCPIYIQKILMVLQKYYIILVSFLTSFPIFLYSIRYSPKLCITICPSIFSILNSFLISFVNKIINRKKLYTWIHYQDLEIEAAFNLNIIQGKYAKKIILSLERLMLNQIDFISSISTGMIKRIKNKLGDKNKLLYFPNFTDSHIFEINSCSKIDNPFLEYLDLKKGKKVIMYSGTFNEKYLIKQY